MEVNLFFSGVYEERKSLITKSIISHDTQGRYSSLIQSRLEQMGWKNNLTIAIPIAIVANAI